MRTVVAVLASGLLLSACGATPVERDRTSGLESQTAASSAPAAAPAVVQPKSPPAPRKVSTPAPSLDLLCPMAGDAPAFVEFGWDGDWTGEATVEMDYGDGDSYTAVGDEQVREFAFSHDYDSGGDFFVTATLTDGEGRSVMATCSLTLTESVVYAAPPVSRGYGGSIDDGDCSFNGIPLHGDVRVVEYGGDMSVRRVDYGGDLVVREMTYGGGRNCGEWRFVDYGGDFTVRFVDYGGDFTVRFAGY
jgi:hypothetical protein